MKILVAVDISPNTVRICEFLQQYLKISESPDVTILHVYEPELDFTEDHPLKEGEILPTSEAKLQHIFQPLESNCTLSYEITNEHPGTCIVSRTAHVDLVVMGRRHRTQMQEMLMGSLSQYVLHRAECPVLIVPGRS
jgi:nucleotide-binding universal stress UspA family protein